MSRRWVVIVGCGALAAALAAPSAAAHMATRRATGPDNAVLADWIGEDHLLEHQAAAREALHPTPAARPLPLTVSDPSVVGQWAKPTVPGGSRVIAVHAVLMKTGKVLMWSPYIVTNPDGTKEVQTWAQVWDPTTNTIVRVDPGDDLDIFCGAATVLGDGTVLVVGGAASYTGGFGSIGVPLVMLFDPNTQTWTLAPPMNKGRWYPTVTELQDGGAIVVGGRDASAKPNFDVEKIGPLPAMTPQVVAQYKLNWEQGLYPKQFLLPDGRVFTFGGNRTDFLDPATWTITAGPKTLQPQFDYPNGVILPLRPGGDFKVVVYGGKNTFSGTTTAASYSLDLSTPTPTFQTLTPMPQARTNMNSVMLPDESIMVVGGNATGNIGTPYLQTLMYSSDTDTWTPMASQIKRRAYHSTALLLPDGRVMSAGDNNPAGGLNTIEIYSPPYLFKGARPVITAAPAAANPGDTIVIGTAAPVAKAVLVAPGAVTHATDMHSRLIELSAAPDPTGDGTGLVASIPADGTVPPGPYMLFVLDATGVPSVSTWVQVG